MNLGIFKSRLGVAFLPFFVICEVVFSQDLSVLNPMAKTAMRDFVVAVDFDNSSGLDMFQQQDCLRGVKMALQMWELVLPGLHFRFVNPPVVPNLTIRFTNVNAFRKLMIS